MYLNVFLNMTNMLSHKKNNLPLNSFLKRKLLKKRNIEGTTSVKVKDLKNTPLYTAPVAKMTSSIP